MDVLIPLSICVVLGSLILWIRRSASTFTKAIIALLLFGPIVIVFLYEFIKSPAFAETRKDVEAFVIGFILISFVLCLYYFLPPLIEKLTNKMKRNLKQKQKKEKAKPFKIEIVNNEKYINLKKDKRIAFLRNLKKQTVAELTKQKKELSKEIEKIENIPTDVVKYIKTTNKTKIENNILSLENKINAINELIGLETKK